MKLAQSKIMEDRHVKVATIITSQLPVKPWNEQFKEPILADSIMDRLSAHANRI